MNSRLVSFAILTAVVLAGVAYGVNYLWDKRFGPTTASAADCRLAQQLFDQAQTPPADPAEAEAWEKRLRQIRSAQMADQGLSTQVARYVSWKRIQATGGTERPGAGVLQDITEEAVGHCEDSGVDLTIAKIVF